MRIVAMTMNITSTTPEVVVAFTGNFGQLLAFGNNTATNADGFAVWVPSQGNWLANLNLPVETADGVLLSSLINVTGADALYGGSLTSSTTGGNGAATLSGTTLGQFPIKIQPKAISGATAVRKRDTLAGGVASGVMAGLFDSNNGRDKVVLAGHFTATSTNGSALQNILFVDRKNNNVVTGLGPELNATSTFVAPGAVPGHPVCGGNVTGTISGVIASGLISYNLATNNYNTQPPALTGGNNSVTAIAVRPNTGDVYVGGTFTLAGALGCPGVCFFSTGPEQWNRPGTGLSGAVNTMFWSGDNTLVAGGAVTVNGTSPTPPGYLRREQAGLGHVLGRQ